MQSTNGRGQPPNMLCLSMTIIYCNSEGVPQALRVFRACHTIVSIPDAVDLVV